MMSKNCYLHKNVYHEMVRCLKFQFSHILNKSLINVIRRMSGLLANICIAHNSKYYDTAMPNYITIIDFLWPCSKDLGVCFTNKS